MTVTDLKTMRVDQVWSLLRPAELKSAFANHLKGVITEAALRQAQDDAVREVVFSQQAHQIPIITDGEFRRAHFMESFGEVAGMELWKAKVAETIRALDDAESAAAGETRRGTDPTLHTRRPVTERLRLKRNRPLGEFEFGPRIAVSPVKVSLIDTDRICQGYDAEASRAIYSCKDDFLADVIAVEREIVKGLAQAGCRYIQMDGPSLTRYVDAASLEVMRSLGENPKKSLERAIEADNAVIAGFP